MSFVAAEDSVHGGQPVDLYKFTVLETPLVGTVIEAWATGQVGEPTYPGPFNQNLPATATLTNSSGWTLTTNTFIWAYDPVALTHQYFEWGGNIGDTGGSFTFGKTYTGLDPTHTYRVKISMTAHAAGVYSGITYSGGLGGIQISGGGSGSTSTIATALTRTWTVYRTGTTSFGVGMGVGDTTVQLGHEDWDLRWTISIEDLGDQNGSTDGSVTTTLNYTSATEPVVYQGETYTPATFLRTDLSYGSDETASNEIEVAIPRDHAVAALFFGKLPTRPVRVQLITLHLSDLTDARVPRQGQVIRTRFEGPSMVLTLGGRSLVLDRKLPRVITGKRCWKMLFDDWCQVNPAPYAFSSTATTVDGRFVTVSGAAAWNADPDWFKGGVLLSPGKPPGYIEAQSGDVMTLLQNVPGLLATDEVTLLPGCNRLPSGCQKFNNSLNFGGESMMPIRTPFSGAGIVSGFSDAPEPTT